MIPEPSPHLLFSALSHPGETGKNNEDRWAVRGFRLEPNGPPVTLAVVADGIGGHQAGEVAAELTVETFLSTLSKFEGGDPIPALAAAVADAWRAVTTASHESPDREGMGSTLSAACIMANRLYTVSVGDSRIYWLRHGRLQQLTIDHTWVQEAIDHHLIPPAMARRHPNAHVLRRHLGGREPPAPDFRLRLSPSENDEQSQRNQGLILVPGDRLLLCTDGLTDLVSDREIRAALRRRALPEAADRLVHQARRRGGFDNITVVVLAVPGAAPLGRWRWLGGC